MGQDITTIQLDHVFYMDPSPIDLGKVTRDKSEYIGIICTISGVLAIVTLYM